MMAPLCEPVFDEVEVVVETGVFWFPVGRVWGLLDHLGPDKGAEAPTLGSRVGRVLLLGPEVEEGPIAVDDIVGEPCSCREAVQGSCADRGVVASVTMLSRGGCGLAPVLSD